jgi:hypothetical protein
MIARLRATLAEEGLHIVCPVSQTALDAAGLAISLAALLPVPGASGLVIADGGRDFFQRFQAARPALGPDPLDHYTRQVIPAALARALPAGARFEVRFPFVTDGPPLPIQQLGRAAGLPPPGPLGLQVHPRYGPWWAYRAFAVVPGPLPEERPGDSPCQSCPAPCVVACPAGAVQVTGFGVSACTTRRLEDASCQPSCAARLACPAGASERYSPQQLRFHMAASLVQIRKA